MMTHKQLRLFVFLALGNFSFRLSFSTNNNRDQKETNLIKAYLVNSLLHNPILYLPCTSNLIV